MDTVTYPNESVAAYLNEHFVCAKFNTAQPEAVKEVTRQFRALWTPTFVFLDHHGIEVRRVVGYLPPEEFLPELEMARANALLLNGKAGEAFTLFRHVAEQHGGAAVAPEALYYAGVAGYRRDGTPTELQAQWTILKEQHPDSTWWTRASFIAG
jgi:hypothetical protein